MLPGIELAVPTGQATHEALLEAPSVGLYVPAGHGVNVCLSPRAPTTAQKPPIGHRAHSVCPVFSLSLPAGHAGHSSADSPDALL